MTFNPLAPVPVQTEDMDEATFLAVMPRCCGTCTHAGAITGGTRHMSAYLPNIVCRHAVAQDATPVGHRALLSGPDCPLWSRSSSRAKWSFNGYGAQANEDLRVYASRISRELAKQGK